MKCYSGVVCDCLICGKRNLVRSAQHLHKWRLKPNMFTSLIPCVKIHLGLSLHCLNQTGQGTYARSAYSVTKIQFAVVGFGTVGSNVTTNHCTVENCNLIGAGSAYGAGVVNVSLQTFQKALHLMK